MQILRAFQQLPHIQLDLTRREPDTRILEQASEVVVHVRENHVYRALPISRRYIHPRSSKCARPTGEYNKILTSLDNHVADSHDGRVAQHLQDLDLPKSRHWYAFLFVVHQDPLERNETFGNDVRGFVDFSEIS